MTFYSEDPRSMASVLQHLRHEVDTVVIRQTWVQGAIRALFREHMFPAVSRWGFIPISGNVPNVITALPFSQTAGAVTNFVPDSDFALCSTRMVNE